jgi:hypothetical protein
VEWSRLCRNVSILVVPLQLQQLHPGTCIADQEGEAAYESTGSRYRTLSNEDTVTEKFTASEPTLL